MARSVTTSGAPGHDAASSGAHVGVMTNRRPLAVVAGATGYLGGHVVRAAKAAGYRVRALARDPERLGELRELCDDVFVGQATNATTLEGLFEGADVAFSSIGVRHFRRAPTVWDVDAGANLNLVDAAERAGVRRFVFVSVLGGTTMRRTVPAAEARERVVERLAASTMSWAVLRPTGFFNDMRDILEMARAGRVWLVGQGASRLNPIHGADLADAAVECFDGDLNVTRELGGPDALSTREVGALAFAALGRAPRFGSVPLWTLRLLAALILPFNVNLGSFLRMFVALEERGEAIGEAHGTHHLEAFFAEEARSR